MTEQGQVSPRLVALKRKAQVVRTLFVKDLRIDDMVEIETTNSVYKIEFLSDVSSPHRRVRLQKKSTKIGDNRFEEPRILKTRGLFHNGTFYDGCISCEYSFHLEESGGTLMELSPTKLVKVNGVQILP